MKYWKSLKRDHLGLFGLMILIFLSILALLAPVLQSINPEIYSPLQGYDPEIFGVSSPSLRHLLGTDSWGRDILSQILFGIRTAFLVGFSAAISAIFIGTFLGLASAWFGGIVETLVMRSVDIIFCLPFIPILIVVSGVFGGLDIWSVVIIIAILSWAGIARVVRSQALSLKERDYVEASRASGAGNLRIIFRHLLPGVLPLVVVFLCFKISGVIFLTASLSFLGFMASPNTVSLGQILNICLKTGHAFSAPFWMLPPGLTISLFSLGFYLLGRSISDTLSNPKLKYQ